MPFSSIYVLSASSNTEGIEFNKLSLRESILALSRHTQASRLFSAALLRGHLDFCAWIAEHIPVIHLIYPRKLSMIPEVWQRLTVDVEKQLNIFAGPNLV